jgi:hypothetical protein
MKLTKPFAELHIRLGRGQALAYEIKGALTLAMAFKVLFGVTLMWTIVLTAMTFVLFFLVGWFDLKYFKSAQEENKLNTSKYNPHLNKIGKPNNKRFK